MRNEGENDLGGAKRMHALISTKVNSAVTVVVGSIVASSKS